MKRIYLVDGMSVVFRAYHAMQRSGLKSKSGEPTFAVFAFINILGSLIEKKQPEYLSIVFDTREPTFRHLIYEQYKANRDAFPDDLVPQLERIKEFLDIASIPRIEMPGYEADDIIGTIAKNAANSGYEAICVTNDKDYYQLVEEKILLYKPSRDAKNEFQIIDSDAVLEKYGVTPDQVIDVMALIGDSSDNIPGVKGIGEKTAIPLIQQFSSIENLYENLTQVERPIIRNKLSDDKVKAFLAKQLVTIKIDVPIQIDFSQLTRKTPNFDKLIHFFNELSIEQLKSKWIPNDFEFTHQFSNQQSETHIQSIEHSDRHYSLINNFSELEEMLAELEQEELLSVDIETSSLDKMNCEIVGISLSAKEGRAFYVPIDGELENYESTNYADNSLFASNEESKQNDYANEKLNFKEVFSKLKSILESDKIGKCGQNLKFDAFILKRYGIDLKPIVFDSMLASYVLNPDEQHNLDALSEKWLSYKPISISLLIGEKKSTQKSMKNLAPKDISDYACEDADLALKLRNKLAPELKKENLFGLAEQIEFPLVEVLTQMEYNGIAIEPKILSDISKKIVNIANDLTDNIYKEAGTEFNIDSPKQLGFVLFEKMQIPPIKKTKTGYSTDAQTLSQLEEYYPIAKMISEYRQLTKLKNTYIDTLPLLVNKRTNRIHTTYNQIGTSTGRLSSNDPNLQNIPIRTDIGREIRKAFVAGNKESLIFAADYSQVELRILAYISNDARLIEAFKSGKDIHSATAALIFGVLLDKVDSKMRRAAKAVNFGIIYGLGSFGLSQRLGISRNGAKQIIDDYLAKYSGIREYMDSTIANTEKFGYAITLAGRRRYFQDINSKNHNLRSAAQRAAINMPIQGTAADMLKIAMCNIHHQLKKGKYKTQMLLQVHDELVFEVPKSELVEIQALVVEQMQSALPLGEVPVIVDTGFGEHWFDAH